MVTLNDYLYSGDTVLRILQKYMQDLRKEAKETHNEIDLAHCNFLIQIMELLEHNDFLTAQSQKIREFYKYMAREYPYLSFTFKELSRSSVPKRSLTAMWWNIFMITIRSIMNILRCWN